MSNKRAKDIGPILCTNALFQTLVHGDVGKSMFVTYILELATIRNFHLFSYVFPKQRRCALL